MSKSIEFLAALWGELDTVIELFVYLGIAAAMRWIFGITYMQAIGIVFVYFIMSLLRIVVETFKNRIR